MLVIFLAGSALRHEGTCLRCACMRQISFLVLQQPGAPEVFESLRIPDCSPSLSSPAVMHNHLVESIHHSSCLETQPYITEPTSKSADSALEPGVAMRLLKQKAVADQPMGTAISQSHAAHPDREGIELQEQGHADMLEHAVGKSQCSLAKTGCTTLSMTQVLQHRGQPEIHWCLADCDLHCTTMCK